MLRQQRADVNRNFPELSRGPEEGLGRQEGERGRQARGDLEQRDTSTIRTVLWNEKWFMGLTGVSLFPPREGL